MEAEGFREVQSERGFAVGHFGRRQGTQMGGETHLRSRLGRMFQAPGPREAAFVQFRSIANGNLVDKCEVAKWRRRSAGGLIYPLIAMTVAVESGLETGYSTEKLLQISPLYGELLDSLEMAYSRQKNMPRDTWAFAIEKSPSCSKEIQEHRNPIKER